METDDIEQLVQRSHSMDAEVRNAALRQMQELSDETLLQLLAGFSSPLRSYNRRLARRTINAMLYVAFAFAIALALSRDPSADPRLKWILTAFGLGILVLALAICYVHYSASGRNHTAKGSSDRSLSFPMIMLMEGRTDRRFLPYLLSEIDGVSALFERAKEDTDSFPPSLPLAPALWGRSSYKPPAPRFVQQTRRRYRKLLRGLLSQVEPEETLELSTEQMRALLTLLQRPEEEVELTVGILAHLEYGGDAQAVPVLKRLIREDHWYVGSDRVEAAARGALESVENRLQQQKQGKTLLRPGHALDATPPEALLRPAIDQQEPAQEQLLRPGQTSPPDRSR